MVKRVLCFALAAVLAAAVAVPAAAAEGDVGNVRWLDVELPRELVEQIRADQEEYPGYYALNYIESMGLLSVSQFETYGEGWVFDTGTGEQTGYFEVWPLSEELNVFTYDNGYEEYGVMDNEGRVIIEPVCMTPDSLGGGMFGMVSRSEGKVYIFNSEGKVVGVYDGTRVEALYEDATEADRDWMCAVWSDDSPELVNADGEVVVPFGQYSSFRSGSGRYVIAADNSGDWGIISWDKYIGCSTVFPCLFDSLWFCSEDLVVASYDDDQVISNKFNVGVMNMRMDVVIPFDYDYISSFDHGLAAAIIISSSYDTIFGVIDMEGNIVVPFQYRRAEVCGESGGIIVDGIMGEQDAGVGLLDLEGNEVLPMEYDRINNMGDGYFAVAKDGQCGIVDARGKFVLGPVEGYAADLHGDAAVIYGGSGPDDGVYSAPMCLMDMKGKVLLDLERFDEVIFDGDYPGVVVREGGKYGLYSLEGEELLPVRYDILCPYHADGGEDFDTYLAMDGRRVGMYGGPDAQGAGGPSMWLWVGIGAGAVALVAAAAVITVSARRKKRVAAVPAPVETPVRPTGPADPVTAAVETPSPGRDEAAADAGDGGTETGKRIVGVFTRPEAPTFCPWCGKELKAGFAFCPRCGKELPR